MNSGVLLSESETDTSETSERQSGLLSAQGSIKGKLEEFSAKLDRLRLDDENSEEEYALKSQSISVNSEGNISRSVSASASASASAKLRNSQSPVQEYTSDTNPETDTSFRVKIRLRPIGSIPQIQPRICQISSHQNFSALVKFLCKRLKRNHVHCYINNAFAPSLNQTIGDLWSQFKTNDELIVSYCETVAFG